MSERTFKVGSTLMQGDDVLAWQHTLNEQLRSWGVTGRPVKADGFYGVQTRSWTSTVLKGLGIAQDRMANGVTPWLRAKVRNRRLSVAERWRYAKRGEFRRGLAAKLSPVHTPIAKVLADSWGYHPGVHDGLDLICEPSAQLFAMCDGVVIRADEAGWWGLGAPADANLRAKGDGVIVIRCGTDAGPFEKGLNIVYGHAEAPRVQEGQKVRAGDVIGRAGFANAWHVHLCINDRTDDRGVGDRDPRPFYDYARRSA